MPYEISLIDAKGKTLHSEPAKQMKRFSMTCAANQKRLDTLLKQYPTVIWGKLGNYDYVVQNGRSRVIIIEQDLPFLRAARGY
jgi:hypothetical protein